jgi:hypothetical protein
MLNVGMALQTIALSQAHPDPQSYTSYLTKAVFRRPRCREQAARAHRAIQRSGRELDWTQIAL